MRQTPRDGRLRVVVVHNRYRSVLPSGENSVVRDEMRRIAAAGVEVVPFEDDSDRIANMPLHQRVTLPVRPVHSRESVRQLSRLMVEHTPDVVHVHNVFPLLSPSVVRVAVKFGARVVHTLHNYRHGCVAGTYFRDGHICRDCDASSLQWPAVLHGCYRGSRLQSVPMVASSIVHRSTWRMVDRYLVLTPFMREFAIDRGVAPDRVIMHPTSAPDPGPTPAPGSTLVFAGRIEEEKGITLLLDAWRRSTLRASWTLAVAGDGPLDALVRRVARDDPTIRPLGQLDPLAMREVFCSAGAVVVPSLLFEGLPKVAIEALACGRGVVVGRHTSVAGEVDPTALWLYDSDVVSLATTLDTLTDTAAVARTGAAARTVYQSRYTPEASTERLLGIYAGLA